VHRRPIELSSTVAEATGLLRSTLSASIELRLDLERAPARILADPTSIHQVMMNLITNAVDAMPGGGTVEVRAEPFYVRDSFARAHPGLREGHYAILAIRDAGTGMDEATRARAFEPFFTTKDAGRGSGLGLAMVHGIVRDHGGAVWLDSAPGAGTTVSLLLPVADAEPEAEVALAAAETRGAGEHVLIVDDEPSLVEIGRRRLVALGYRATVAWSAEEALSLFRTSPDLFDLVITDYSMPRTNGVELARELTAQRPDLPILLVTGYADDSVEGDLDSAGVAGVLKKPLTARELGAAVAEALGDRRRRPS
jgi:CheY-like chemotaxis protein